MVDWLLAISPSLQIGHTLIDRASVRHGVDDRVHTQAVGIRCEFGGIIGIVHPFPGIAQIGVIRDQDHEPASIIENSADSWLGIVGLLPGLGLTVAKRISSSQANVRR